MGQKVHPVGFRLPQYRTWNAHWFYPISSEGYSNLLKEDFTLYKYIRGAIHNSTDLPKIARKRGDIDILLHFHHLFKRLSRGKFFKRGFKRGKFFKRKPRGTFFKKNPRGTSRGKNKSWHVNVTGKKRNKHRHVTRLKNNTKDFLFKKKRRYLHYKDYIALKNMKNLRHSSVQLLLFYGELRKRLRSLKKKLRIKRLKLWKKRIINKRLRIKRLKLWKKRIINRNRNRNRRFRKKQHKHKTWVMRRSVRTLRRFSHRNALKYKFYIKALKYKWKRVKRRLKRLKNPFAKVSLELRDLRKDIKALASSHHVKWHKKREAKASSHHVRWLMKREAKASSEFMTLRQKIKKLHVRLHTFHLLLKIFKGKLKGFQELHDRTLPFKTLTSGKLIKLKYKLRKIHGTLRKFKRILRKLRRLKRLKRYKLLKKILKKLRRKWRRSRGFHELKKLKKKIQGLRLNLYKHSGTSCDDHLLFKKKSEYDLEKLKDMMGVSLNMARRHERLRRNDRLRRRSHPQQTHVPHITFKNKNFKNIKEKNLKDIRNRQRRGNIQRRGHIRNKRLHQKNLRKTLLKVKKILRCATKGKIRLLTRLHGKQYKLAYISSSYIGKYLSHTLLRFSRRFQKVCEKVSLILKKIIINFKDKKKRKIRGFRVKYAGKLWSKGRSKKKVFNYGPLSMQNLNNLVDYNFTKVVTKLGVTGFKIWLNYYPRHPSLERKNIIYYKPWMHLLNYKRKIYGLGLLLILYKNFLRNRIMQG